MAQARRRRAGVDDRASRREPVTKSCTLRQLIFFCNIYTEISKNKACEVFVNTGCSKNYIFPPYCINNGRLAHNVSRTAIAIKATNVNILKPFLFLIISPLDK